MQRLRIVVDANMLISLLMAEGSKRKLFFSEYLNPVAPEFVLFETGKYWNEVIEKCGLPDEIVKGVFSEVRRAVRTYSLADMKDFIDDATQAAPDKDDAEYFALALMLNCPIWSEDKQLKKQSAVEVLTTPKLLVRLGVK